MFKRQWSLFLLPVLLWVIFLGFAVALPVRIVRFGMDGDFFVGLGIAIGVWLFAGLVTWLAWDRAKRFKKRHNPFAPDTEERAFKLLEENLLSEPTLREAVQVLLDEHSDASEPGPCFCSQCSMLRRALKARPVREDARLSEKHIEAVYKAVPFSRYGYEERVRRAIANAASDHGYDVARQRALKDFAEIEQTLGQALGYPWFKDDQENWPGSTEEHGVCVGEHVPMTLAMEAADRLKANGARPVPTEARYKPLVEALEADHELDNHIIEHDPCPVACVLRLGLWHTARIKRIEALLGVGVEPARANATRLREAGAE